MLQEKLRFFYYRERSEDTRQEQERRLDDQSFQIKDLTRRVSYQLPTKNYFVYSLNMIIEWRTCYPCRTSSQTKRSTGWAPTHCRKVAESRKCHWEIQKEAWRNCRSKTSIKNHGRSKPCIDGPQSKDRRWILQRACLQDLDGFLQGSSSQARDQEQWVDAWKEQDRIWIGTIHKEGSFDGSRKGFLYRFNSSSRRSTPGSSTW